MKIIDIIKDSAMLLGLKEDVEIIEHINEENYVEMMVEHKNISSLFNLIKYSIRELCTNYVPVATSVRIKTMDKKYPISSLSNFIRVQNVYQNSEMIKYKLINRSLIFEEDGEFEVSYLTYPEIVTMFDEIDFLQNFSPDVIVLGLCSYYSLANAMFEEFEDLHERYVSKAESLKNLKIFDLPCRRWE